MLLARTITFYGQIRHIRDFCRFAKEFGIQQAVRLFGVSSLNVLGLKIPFQACHILPALISQNGPYCRFIEIISFQGKVVISSNPESNLIFAGSNPIRL